MPTMMRMLPVSSQAHSTKRTEEPLDARHPVERPCLLEDERPVLAPDSPCLQRQSGQPTLVWHEGQLVVLLDLSRTGQVRRRRVFSPVRLTQLHQRRLRSPS